MTEEIRPVKLTKRDTYTVKTLLNDLKKLRLTPNSLYIVGNEVLYFEWTEAVNNLGREDPIAAYLQELLTFMESDYEDRLVEGDIRREDDTIGATFTSYLKDTPSEFQSYTLERSGEFIRGVLMAAQSQSMRDLHRYAKIEQSLRKRLEEKPKDPDLWNEMRIALWIQGKYEEASEAHKKAKKLGWDRRKSKTVGV
ncbi:MAG: hypothetical protein ACFFED_07830 [Candidatus Thorarchaeota archaeon]